MIVCGRRVACFLFFFAIYRINSNRMWYSADGNKQIARRGGLKKWGRWFNLFLFKLRCSIWWFQWPHSIEDTFDVYFQIVCLDAFEHTDYDTVGLLSQGFQLKKHVEVEQNHTRRIWPCVPKDQKVHSFSEHVHCIGIFVRKAMIQNSSR